MDVENRLAVESADSLEMEKRSRRERMVQHLELLRQGIINARAGRREPARDLFLEAIEIDDRQEVTWLWLASVARGQPEIRHSMERVLMINPANRRAIDWLRQAGSLQACREKLHLQAREKPEHAADDADHDIRSENEKSSTPMVLAIDDSPTVRKLVAITLMRHGYRVETASDGMEALARMQEMIPDLVLLDISMPHLDGYQICKVIKANAQTQTVPVIMLSGKDGFIDKVRARMAGAIDYITKPIEPKLLTRRIDKILGGTEQTVPAGESGLPEVP